MFGGRELCSVLDMLTLNENFKEDRANLLFSGGVAKGSFSSGNYRSSIKKSSRH